MHVAHLTSVHSRYDTRIFLKECRSVAAAGHETVLVVADGLPSETRDSVRIVGARKFSSRWKRIFLAPKVVLAKALEVNADIYHLHDPELLTIALALKRAGKLVVFDAHEDLPKQILTKAYIWKPIRGLLASLVRGYESYICRKLSAVVTATPAICDKFLEINPATVDINNFPLPGELAAEPSARQELQKQVCYVGGITNIRGIRQLADSMSLVTSGVRLKLAGPFGDKNLAAEVRLMPGWELVDELGVLGRTEVRDLLASSMAGIVTFLPAPNHVEAQPNKMFEYMSAGVPVIASNFPLWREIIEGNECGLCVDPMDPKAIAEAIDWIATHPEDARRMGENGKQAVLERYNWLAEERKLVKLYESLL